MQPRFPPRGTPEHAKFVEEWLMKERVDNERQWRLLREIEGLTTGLDPIVSIAGVQVVTGIGSGSGSGSGSALCPCPFEYTVTQSTGSRYNGTYQAYCVAPSGGRFRWLNVQSVSWGTMTTRGSWDVSGGIVDIGLEIHDPINSDCSMFYHASGISSFCDGFSATILSSTTCHPGQVFPASIAISSF